MKLKKMGVYKVSIRVENDLIAIYIRGLNKWGETQSLDYQKKLIATFSLLVENPGIGKSLPIHKKIKRFEKTPYILFYKKVNYGVRIVRVLYKNRAMERFI